MAASLLIEEESGTYTGRIRHSHNGYYAGDFSQTPRSATELLASYAGRRYLPRAEAQYGGAHVLATSTVIPNRAEHRNQLGVTSLREL